MTREEAINVMSQMIKDEEGFLSDNTVEAHKMAIKALEQERSRSAEITQYRYDCEKLMEENERLKKALEQEPKAGRWIDTGSESFEFHRVYKCSECGNTEIEYPERICGHFRYCPNCGAKMESEDKE